MLRYKISLYIQKLIGKEIGNIINKINEIMISSSSKRGVDFGLERGYSGSQALKYARGIDAAKRGPGRKKRTGPSAGQMEE